MLATARLRLEPVADEHLRLLTGLNSEQDVMRYLLGRPATPAETAEEWRARRDLQSDPARGLGYWVGLEGDSFVGWWSASSFAADPSQAGLGYRLTRSAWGRGLATEGALRMLDQAFACPDVDRVVASTMAVNTASRQVLRKCGLSHVGTLHQTWEEPIPGWEQGEVTYAITRDEWAAQ